MSEQPDLTWIWRATLTAFISALGFAVWQIWSLGVSLRDDSRDHTSSLARIEKQLPEIWIRINDHERRIEYIEGVRPLPFQRPPATVNPPP